MAQTHIITVYCNKCSAKLYRYKKEGVGLLVKCFTSMILEDYTSGNLKCPECGQDFARHAIIHNKPAHKIIQGKVFVRGGHG